MRPYTIERKQSGPGRRLQRTSAANQESPNLHEISNQRVIGQVDSWMQNRGEDFEVRKILYTTCSGELESRLYFQSKL